MNNRIIALICAWLVAIIYGATFTIAKDVMPQYVDAYGFIVIRVGGATLLFWLISFFGPKEKIEKQDWKRIFICALTGISFNMLTFFKGLSYTSPIMGSVLMVTTPMLVFILSIFILKQKLKQKKIIGIILGLAGTLLLIYYGKKASSNATNPALGNFLVFLNAASYSFYLIWVKQLMDKYHPFTFIKYIYLIGLFMVLPFGWKELEAVNFSALPNVIILKILFVIICSTFLTYLLNLFSMKKLNPTTVAIFIYLQPFFASLFAIYAQKDSLDTSKIIAAALIFVGVYLVTHKKKSKINRV